MYTIRKLKHLRVPIQVEDIKEVQYTGVVDPEDSVIVLRGAVGVVVEERSQRGRPVREV